MSPNAWQGVAASSANKHPLLASSSTTSATTTSSSPATRPIWVPALAGLVGLLLLCMIGGGKRHRFLRYGILAILLIGYVRNTFSAVV